MTALVSIYILSALSFIFSRGSRILDFSGAVLAVAYLLAAFALGIAADCISAGILGLICCAALTLPHTEGHGK